MSFGNQGARVWRKTGEKEMPKCLKSSVKYPQSVMVWGAMSAAGVGPLCFIKGRVNAASYQEILEHFMLPSAEMLYGDEDFIFQHDLAPAHSAKKPLGPLVDITIPSLDLGLIKLGNKTLSKFTIANVSPLEAKWKIQESKACIDARGEEESRFSISPEGGVLPPLGTREVSVVFKPSVCQRLETVLELEVENGEGSYLPVTASVQVPQVCLLSSSLVFNEIYVGVQAQSAIKMFNQGQLPAKFSWQEKALNRNETEIYM
ncbi:unnamed protein product [Ranitomeya imitator]|uniref:HYDIN/VesB/CFA65-like Ig-like domain-containing protein n=1 Tax=Ranitomeya imitator TaxID=111125 RepID=A0ABN9KR20_9NEOB|nr:unnamed protein product [Ranitomeya imitator]